MLKTKSIDLAPSSEDGLRIAVMRKIKPEHQFDIWMPVLAPSLELVEEYTKKKTISWEEFKPQFVEQLKDRVDILEFVAKFSLDYEVTLLCYEVDYHHCHRRILTEKCQELQPELKVAHVK